MTNTIDEADAPGGSASGELSGALRFQIFDGAPVAELDDLMAPPAIPASVLESFAPADLAFLNEGFRTEPVFRDSDPSGFSLVNVRLAPDAILPAHTHEVDCLYYVLSGSIHLGRRVLGPGAGFFVPANKAYGYRAGSEGTAILEFRHATHFGMVITETSHSRWRELFDNAKRHAGWPGFRERVALRSQ